MNCSHCGSTVKVRKSLQRGKSATPDECPDCGEELTQKGVSPTALEK